jgi:hypothetical protein
VRLRLVILIVGLVLVTQLAVAAGAKGGGIPVAKGVPGTISADPDGLTVPGSPDRYVQLLAHGTTVIARVDQDGGEVVRSRPFEDELSIPTVGYDGTPGGLSADGNTLVLLPAQQSSTKTRFVILDAKSLGVRDRVELPGRFSFDAISPDGARMYLIEYLSRIDPTRYAVRRYDLSSGRLLRAPVVDPDEPPGEMQGTAVTRVNSPDGRWAYTLYDGDEYPFIHALDTAEGRAVCIDLESIADYRRRDSLHLTIGAGGSELTVLDHKRTPRAVVDTQTFAVSDPSEPDAGSGFPWLGVVLVPLALAGAWLLARTIRRRRLARVVRGRRRGGAWT